MYVHCMYSTSAQTKQSWMEPFSKMFSIRLTTCLMFNSVQSVLQWLQQCRSLEDEESGCTCAFLANYQHDELLQTKISIASLLETHSNWLSSLRLSNKRKRRTMLNLLAFLPKARWFLPTWRNCSEEIALSGRKQRFLKEKSLFVYCTMYNVHTSVENSLTK